MFDTLINSWFIFLFIGYQRKVIMRLDTIIENQHQLTELIHQIGKGRPDMNYVEDVLERPLHTIEELETFGQKLSDPTFKRKLLSTSVWQWGSYDEYDIEKKQPNPNLTVEV